MALTSADFAAATQAIGLDLNLIEALKEPQRLDPYLAWSLICSSLPQPHRDGTPRIGILAELLDADKLPQNALPTFVIGGDAPALTYRSLLVQAELLGELISNPRSHGIKRFELSLPRGRDGAISADGEPLNLQRLVRMPKAQRQAVATRLAKSECKALPDPIGSYAAIQNTISPLVCVIDDGCNFASAGLLMGSASRIASIWHQGDGDKLVEKLGLAGWKSALQLLVHWKPFSQDGLIPIWDISGATYGRRLETSERTKEGFSAQSPPPRGQARDSTARTSLPIGESEVYRRTNYMHPSLRWQHGTAVLDIIAGTTLWAIDARQRQGRVPWLVAPENMKFVQLPETTVSDTSGGSLASHALDGIHYALSEAQPGQTVIVNLSYGSHSGGHDATSMWDRAVLELLEAYNGLNPQTLFKTLHLVVPAGNSHLVRCHSSKSLTREDPALELRWKIAPDNHNDSHLEIWLPPKVEVKISVWSPDGEKRESEGSEIVLWRMPNGGGSAPAAAALIWPKSVPQSELGTMALLAVAPTTTVPKFYRNPQTKGLLRDAVALHGVWRVKIEFVRGEEGSCVHAWVQRSDAAPGRGRASRGYRGRQSHLLEPVRDSIDPRSSLNGIAALSHKRFHVVGAMRRDDAQLSDYSGSGPNRIDPGRFEGPDLVLPADESQNLRGLMLRGVLSGSRLRISGSSMAAAVYTRILYEDLSSSPLKVSLEGPYLEAPTRAPQIAEGAPAQALAMHRGDWRKLIPDHPFGHLSRWPSG